jgi:hypothetical protein
VGAIYKSTLAASGIDCCIGLHVSVLMCLHESALPPLLQVLSLLLSLGDKSLAHAQEPEGALYATIQNRIKMLTAPLPSKVQVSHGGGSGGLSRKTTRHSALWFE